MLTVTFAPFATMMLDIVRVRVRPEPVSVPLVAPVTVISFTVRAAGSALNVRVSCVVVALPLVPFADRPFQLTAVGDVGETFTATFLVVGLIVKPAG